MHTRDLIAFGGDSTEDALSTPPTPIHVTRACALNPDFSVPSPCMCTVRPWHPTGPTFVSTTYVRSIADVDSAHLEQVLRERISVFDDVLRLHDPESRLSLRLRVQDNFIHRSNTRIDTYLISASIYSLLFALCSYLYVDGHWQDLPRHPPLLDTYTRLRLAPCLSL